MSALSRKSILVLTAVLAVVLGVAPMAWAEPVGLIFDASAMRCIYTKGSGGPGSIGRIDIGLQDGLSSLVVQELALGSDQQIGGGDDTVIDMARITEGSFNFGATFSADVFQLGVNSYAIVGTYTIQDFNGAVVVEGDFNSDLASLNNDSLFLGGSLSNADGILRPTGTSSWSFSGMSSATPNTINGVFGGADGIDGTVTLNSGRELSTLASLFDFQFVGSFPDLDAFFASDVQASNVANLKVQVTVVPLPGATGLAAVGLGIVAAIRRRLRPSNKPIPTAA